MILLATPSTAADEVDHLDLVAGFEHGARVVGLRHDRSVDLHGHAIRAQIEFFQERLEPGLC